MELRDYVRMLHKSWVLVVVCTVLGIAGGAGLSFLMTPTYAAHIQLYVSVRGESQTSGDLAQGSTFARQSVQSYVNIVPTDSVLKPVIDELGLTETADELAEHVTAGVPANTSLLDITVEYTNPEKAAQIADSVGRSFTRLVQDELEATDSKSVSPVKLTTVQSAEIPKNPVKPNTALNVVLGLILGLGLGTGLALLRSLLDTRIHSARDLEQITDAPLVGNIAYDPRAKSRPLIIHSDPRHPRAEAFRALRTNLQFLAVNDTHSTTGQSFVVTSAGPGEGKSTTVANLVVALSESGARVILIDADLRLPRMADYMGIEGTVGLTDVLIGRVALVDAVQRWGSGELFLLPAGKVPPNPSELLGSHAMQDMLTTLQEQFDYVIIDSPPLGVVTDAAVVSKITNGTLILAASGSTRKPAFENAIQTLTTAGGTLRGVILTKTPAKGPDSAGYGNYGYGNYGNYTPETTTTTTTTTTAHTDTPPPTKKPTRTGRRGTATT